MWSDDELKQLEHEMTPEEKKLYHDRWETKFLKQRLEDFRTAALITTSTAWTDEARKYCIAVADGAVPAIKSLDDQIKILTLRIKTLEAKNV